MFKRCLFLSFLLLCFVKENPHLFPQSYQSLPKPLKRWKDYLLQKHKGSIASRFAIASVAGIKNHLPRKLRNKLKEHHLLHICTPSGLHLSALFSFLFLFLKKARPFIKIGLFFLCFLLPGFYSLKRIALLGCSTLAMKSYPFQRKFLWVMGLDLFFGTFRYSPLSWIYSFTYLSLFIYSSSHILTRLYYYLATLFLFALFNETTLSLISLPINFIYSSLFSLLYPVLFMDTLISFLWLSPVYEFFLSAIPALPAFSAFSSSLNLYLAFYLTPWKLPFLLTILLHSSPVGLRKTFSLSQPKWFYSLPKKNFQVDYWEKGILVTSKTRKCKIHQNGFGMKIHCRGKRPKINRPKFY